MNKLQKSVMNLQCELVAERNRLNQKEITWLQFDILNVLRPENPCSPSELSEYLGISRSKFSKAVKELKDLNYITQIIDERDGRSLITMITSQGKDLLTTIDEGHRYLLEIARDIFSKQEQETFIALANRLSQKLADERMKNFG
ncbi:hypothetical protein YDYSY3_59970 [Paenibacillus chitinolyticus]|uniref:MarR family winged helix-turn-helix transcriptional regulator n=1 Tax=Paenibacillus chitinolyticus TaxID=79263 RepID=UPI0026E4E4A0|nr:MarR family winged helix-turn-helix transcriptional regulator [Paenibacillus chitinolyticus]GKS14997.1 hypothetical protein YDYSY3_59970 [Paenibacillus chitinolyticus]